MNAPRLATGAPCTAKPTAGTVCSAGSTSMRRSPEVMVWPISNGTSCSIGDSADGRRVKSGQMTPLKMCARMASIVAGSACTWIGTRSLRVRITLSASKPIDKYVVQMRVADQDVIDLAQFLQRQIADAGAGVEQHVGVEQERRRAAGAADRTGTTEDADLHRAV